MKNTSNRRNQSARNQSAAIVADVETITEAITPDNPPAMESQEHAITDETPSLEDERAANIAEVKSLIDSYDGKPKSIQLAEYKAQFDFFLELCGKYPTKTGESKLYAWEFTLALLNHASIDNDGVNPSPEFLSHCKAIADKRERPKTKEEIQAEKIQAEKTAAEKAAADRIHNIKTLFDIVSGDRGKIDKFLKSQGNDPTTDEEFAMAEKHFA